MFLVVFLCFELTFSLCTFNSTQSDLPTTWSYSSLEDVRTCFENIPLNESMANQTMIQLFNSLDFYSFLSLIRQSNAPYYTDVKFREELLNISNQYKTDYDFHQAVVYSFKKLKDFHTKYFAPYAYAQFNLLLPFIFEYIPTTKQIKVQVANHLYSSIVQSTANMNYSNKILTQIDGLDAFDYIKQFSNEYSLMSKDENARLNSVFREEFWLRNLAQYPLPLKNNVTFTFLNDNQTTTMVTFPYVVIISKQYNNQKDIENDNLFSESPFTYPNREVYDYIIIFEKLNYYEQKNQTNFELITAGNGTYYYIHKPTKTSIIRLGSFDEQILDSIKNVLLSANGNTLIIDVIGNRGGHSCLSYSLLKYLVPEYSNLSRLYEPMDGRTTAALFTFSKVFSLYPNSMLDLRNLSSFTNMDWIEPYVNYTRGNVIDEYSMKWSINCDGAAFGAGKFWLQNPSKYFQSVYVLTDGTCGSACSLFVSKLRYASNVKLIYGIGGGYNHENLFESSSYAGGGAFDWNTIVQYSKEMGQKDSSIDYLPTSAFLNLNVFEIYIRELSETYPREYLKQPIDRKLNNANYFNLDQSFEQIINEHFQSNGNHLQQNLLLKLTTVVILFQFRISII